MSKYRDAHPVMPKVCGRCGVEFIPIYMSAKFCSSKCRQNNATNPIKCARCGVVFLATKKGRKYCTKKCADLAFKIVETKECKHCGKSFVLPRRSKKEPMIYCSNACKFLDMTNPTKGTQRTCSECGVVFVSWSGWDKRNVKFCSDKCATSNENRKRNAIHRGASSVIGKVNLFEVAERDKWTCGICYKNIDMNLKFPHRMSASIDHVIPVSIGGVHSIANVQLAHLSCNASKGNKLIPAPSISLMG